MNIVSDPFPVATLLRNLLGWGIKYVSCGLLTFVLLMCFAALVFVQIALWGPDVRWLGSLARVLPPGMFARAMAAGDRGAPVDLGAVLSRVYWATSLTLTALAALWRLLKRWRSGAPLAHEPVSIADGLSLKPVAQHVRIHAKRRFLPGLAAVSTIFAAAFIAIPHARMATGSSHAGMAFVFIVLYLLALAMTAAYIGIGIAADLVLDG